MKFKIFSKHEYQLYMYINNNEFLKFTFMKYYISLIHEILMTQKWSILQHIGTYLVHPAAILEPNKRQNPPTNALAAGTTVVVPQVPDKMLEAIPPTTVPRTYTTYTYIHTYTHKLTGHKTLWLLNLNIHHSPVQTKNSVIMLLMATGPWDVTMHNFRKEAKALWMCLPEPAFLYFTINMESIPRNT